jgi:hypothetical protein
MIFRNNKEQADVYLHSKPSCDMALCCHYSLTLSLKVPLETRFACNFFMIASMLQIKDALEQIVIDSRWNEHMSTLFNQQNGHCAYALARAVKATICNDGIGSNVKILNTWFNKSLKI